MVCLRGCSLIIGAIAVVDSALAFAPSSLRDAGSRAYKAPRTASAQLHSSNLKTDGDDNNKKQMRLGVERRDVLERTAAAIAMAGVFSNPLTAFAATEASTAASEGTEAETGPELIVVDADAPPAPVKTSVASTSEIVVDESPRLTTDAWVVAIQPSTIALSDSLGHVLLAIEGLNNQANRIGSSPDPAHSLAVLDGMSAQARRLVSDLDRGSSVLDTLKSQSRDLTPPDDDFEVLVKAMTNASSVFDGLLSQSKRLASASASTGSARSRMTYMLSVLDGLNAQTRRMDVQNTILMLDALNAKAVKAQQQQS